MSSAETPTPAGDDGLSLLGETLAFAKNPFQFIEGRLARDGWIFRSNALGRRTAAVAGSESAGRFIDANGEPSLRLSDRSSPRSTDSRT